MSESDEEFVRRVASELGFGFMTTGRTLGQLSELLFQLLGRREFEDAADMRVTLEQSRVSWYVANYQWRDGEQTQLFNILKKYS